MQARPVQANQRECYKCGKHLQYETLVGYQWVALADAWCQKDIEQKEHHPDAITDTYSAPSQNDQDDKADRCAEIEQDMDLVK